MLLEKFTRLALAASINNHQQSRWFGSRAPIGGCKTCFTTTAETFSKSSKVNTGAYGAAKAALKRSDYLPRSGTTNTGCGFCFSKHRSHFSIQDIPFKNPLNKKEGKKSCSCITYSYCRKNTSYSEKPVSQYCQRN